MFSFRRGSLAAPITAGTVPTSGLAAGGGAGGSVVEAAPADRPSPTTLSRLELRCPPLPTTLVEAMDLMNHPDSIEVKPVAAMVERDPVVVARLLQTVNSAYYGLQRKVNSVERAIVLLGPVAVAGIVVNMSMLRLRSVLDGPASGLFNRLIQHSSATAFITRHLVNTVFGGRRNPSFSAPQWGLSLTAGLLHDFGKIILVYNFPKEAVALYENETLHRQVNLADSRDMERLLFGYDHTEAGEYAGWKLQLPDVLVSVMGNHHDPDRVTGDDALRRLVLVTSAANAAAKGMGHDIHNVLSWEACRQDPIWMVLSAECQAPFDDVEELLAEVAALKPDVDEYVASMSEPVSPPAGRR